MVPKEWIEKAKARILAEVPGAVFNEFSYGNIVSFSVARPSGERAGWFLYKFSGGGEIFKHAPDCLLSSPDFVAMVNDGTMKPCTSDACVFEGVSARMAHGLLRARTEKGAALIVDEMIRRAKWFIEEGVVS